MINGSGDIPTRSDTDSHETPYLRSGVIPEFETLNGHLRALLLDMAATTPDQGTNMPSGRSFFENKWLSIRTLHELVDPGIQKLRAGIEGVANKHAWPNVASDYRLRIDAMWAIVSHQGMEGRPHNHRGTVSGVYYVDAGDSGDNSNGAFAVFDRNGGTVKIVPPRSGLMMMFPSSMVHGVLRYQSVRPRITISFNLS